MNTLTLSNAKSSTQGGGILLRDDGNVTLLAAADFMDHNGVVTSTAEEVTVVWASSDSSIGPVNSSSGIFTPLAPGNITISARYVNGAVASVPMIVT